MQVMVTRISLLGAVAALGIAMHADAQDYPTRPVRIVVPSPGTTAFNLAHLIGPKLTELWHQPNQPDKPVVVEPRVGAPSAMMPAITVAKATPDGYTLLMGET